MKKIAIVILALALAGFGFVGTASAGFTAPVSLDCGDKFTGCSDHDVEWEVIYKCGSLWTDAGTEVDFPGHIGFLTADEIDGDGTCDSMMAIRDDTATRNYRLDCSLPSNAGGNSKRGGKKISLQVKAVGECE